MGAVFTRKNGQSGLLLTASAIAASFLLLLGPGALVGIWKTAR